MNAQNVKEILEVLAEKFGSTGAALWAALIRQVYVDAALAAFWSAVCVVLLVVSWKVHVWLWALMKSKRNPYDTPEMGYMPLAIVVIGLVVSFVVNVNTIFAALNPEYAALRYILTAGAR